MFYSCFGLIGGSGESENDLDGFVKDILLISYQVLYILKQWTNHQTQKSISSKALIYLQKIVIVYDFFLR